MLHFLLGSLITKRELEFFFMTFIIIAQKKLSLNVLLIFHKMFCFNFNVREKFSSGLSKALVKLAKIIQDTVKSVYNGAYNGPNLGTPK